MTALHTEVSELRSVLNPPTWTTQRPAPRPSRRLLRGDFTAAVACVFASHWDRASSAHRAAVLLFVALKSLGILALLELDDAGALLFRLTTLVLCPLSLFGLMPLILRTPCLLRRITPTALISARCGAKQAHCSSH